MVTRRASNAAPPQAPTTPVVKRKRRASCVDEQERRERKRAIDREAQRSLREKTKSHIAELEKTIQVLRDQDRNATTSSLLSEIEILRAENERLREVIDSVRSVIGYDLFPRNDATEGPGSEGGTTHSPVASSLDQSSPKSRAISFASDAKPTLSPSTSAHQQLYQNPAPTSRPLDLDGMTIMTGMEADSPAARDPRVSVNLELQSVTQSPDDEAEDFGNDPATATWAPMMAEIFGPNWRCPSPVILHIGSPEPNNTSPAPSPVWKKSNELLGKVFSYHAPVTEPRDPNSGVNPRGVVLPSAEYAKAARGGQDFQAVEVSS